MSGYDNQPNTLITKNNHPIYTDLGDCMAKKECISAERKAELINAAEELFREKGFENTSVDDIIKKVGVAKGLFYYYFGSKEDLIEILIQRMHKEIESSIVAVLEMKNITAEERFIELLKSQRDVSMRSETVIKYFSMSRNKNLHLEVERLAYEMVVPAFGKIIQQGIEEGVFDTRYPEDSSYTVSMMIRAAMMKIKEHPDIETIEQSLDVLQYMTERILGMETGSFEVYHIFMRTSCPELDHVLNKKN